MGKAGKKAGSGSQIGRSPLRYRILQAAFVLVFCIGAGMLYYHLVAVPKANREMAAQLKADFPGETFPEEVVPENQPAGEKSGLPLLVDLASLQEQYPDVKGWLTIPETGIDYPVLQSGADDPEYYIHRNYKGEPDINGSLFLQWDCDVREGENLVVYGHNMNSGVMFGNLDRYADKEYYETHRYAYFQTLERVQEYEIVSVIKADHTTFPFQRTGFGGTEGMQEYLGQAKRMALFETDYMSAQVPAQVLTLITCSYEWSGARNILVAVPVAGAFGE